MIEVPGLAGLVRGASRVTACRVESWRDGELLAADVPIDGGSLTGDRSLQVTEQVSLIVPVEVNGQRWDPLEEDDPLACYGQQLRISIGVLVGGVFSWVPRAPMLITGTNRDGDTVTVSGAGLLQVVAEARLVTPLQPVEGDTFKTLARRLVEPALPVVFDPDLIDRAVPVSSLQWDEDRLAALYELASAWPADLRIHPDGYLLFEPFGVVGDVTADFREDTIRLTAAQNRDGGINCVVARGMDEVTGEQYQAVAYDLVADSPTRYGGPFSPLPVPQFFSSPLLTSEIECAAAAATVLSRRRRGSARAVQLDIAPWPTTELGDLVLARDDRAGDLVVTVETMTLPLTAGDGAGSLAVAVPV